MEKKKIREKGEKRKNRLELGKEFWIIFSFGLRGGRSLRR